jgi:histone-lysine N-methyltransferase SETMAR
MVSLQKVMILVFWFPLGFPVITVPLRRAKFTAAYFCGDVIPKIIEGMPFDLTDSPRQLMMHMNNVTPRRAREWITRLRKLRICLIDHPPYSPDLAPSGFYLFGKLKDALVGQ